MPERAIADDHDVDLLYCPYCGYDLRALAGETCPECGGKVDEVSLKVVQVPWQNSRGIQAPLAMIRTAWRVSFRTKRFCYGICRPVSYQAARSFQFWVVTLLWLGLVTTIAVPILIQYEEFTNTIDQWGWGLIMATAIPSIIGLWLLLFLATGLHTYWLHPKHIPVEKQNRAVALGYYACGPLLLTALGCLPIAAVIVYMSYLMGPDGDISHDIWIMCLYSLSGLLMVVGCVVFWRTCFVMAGRTAELGPIGRWSLPILQPLLIALLALLPIGLPALLVYLCLIFYTF